MSILDEELIPLSEIGKYLPTSPSKQTRWRWSVQGVGPRKVRLETVKLSGVRFTSRESLRRFLEQLNAVEDSPAEPDVSPEEWERTEAELRQRGLLGNRRKTKAK